MHFVKVSLSILACGLVLSACAEGDFEEVRSFAIGGDLDLPEKDRPEGPLPAWQTDEERQDAKDDSFDVRGTYQDIYGFTNPPSLDTRSVAEFERTDGVLVSWDDFLSPFMVDLVRSMADRTPVWVITDSLAHTRRVDQTLSRQGINTNNVNYFEFQNDSFWTRDYGPITTALPNGDPIFIGPEYYPDRQRDDAIPTLMGRYFNIETYRPPIATEGGNFMSNGQGLCAVTDAVVQHNPQLRTADVHQIKRDYFGCQQTLIVEAMDGEGTGHIDMFAKFVSEDTVLVGSYTVQEDRWNAAILDRNAERFAQMTLPDGRNLRVVRIPMPRASGWVYRSYTNSTIVNDTVVVPTYRTDRRYEAQALQIYRQTMPGYRVVTVDSEEPIELGGAVHCTTMGFATENLGAVPTPDLPQPDLPVEPQVGPESYQSAPDAPIRDLQQTVDRIQVEDQRLIDSMTVTLDIEHTYIGDLLIWLQRGNEQVVLHRQAGGAAQNLQRTYRVDGFAGISRQGEWILVVEDRARMDEGVLRSWAISFD